LNNYNDTFDQLCAISDLKNNEIAKRLEIDPARVSRMRKSKDPCSKVYVLAVMYLIFERRQRCLSQALDTFKSFADEMNSIQAEVEIESTQAL